MREAMRDDEWPDVLDVSDAVLICVVRRADGGDPDDLPDELDLDHQFIARIAPRDAARVLAGMAKRCLAQQFLEDWRN